MSPFGCTSLSLLLLPLVAALPAPQASANITHPSNFTLTTHLPLPTNLTYPYNLTFTTHLPVPTNLTYPYNLTLTTHLPLPTTLTTTTPLNLTTHAPHPTLPRRSLHTTTPLSFTTPHLSFPTDATPTLSSSKLAATGIQLSDEELAAQGEPTWSLGLFKRSLPSPLPTNNHTTSFPLPTNHTAPTAPSPTSPAPLITPRAPLPAVLISVTALPCCDAVPTTTYAATRHKVRDCVACSTKAEVHGGFYNTMNGLLGNLESAVLEFLPSLTTSQNKREVSEVQGGEGVVGEEGGSAQSIADLAYGPPSALEDADIVPLSADELEGMDLGPLHFPTTPSSGPNQEADPPSRLARREEITDEYSPLNALYPGHDPHNPMRKSKPHDAAVRAAVHARYMKLYGELWLKKLVDEVKEAQTNVDQQVSVGRAAVREKEYLEGKRKAVETQLARMKVEAEEAERLSVIADVQAVGGSAGMDVGFIGG